MVLLVVILAYLMGSLPVAYLVSKAVRGIDIRLAGSRNVGALNVYRQAGSRAALAVLVLDGGKGVLAMFIPQWLGAPEVATYLAALSVTVGHNWSVFLGFNGGKGAATVVGVSFAVLPLLTALVVPVLITALFLTRNVVVSLAVAFVMLNVLTIFTSQPTAQIALCLALTALVAGTHFYRSGPQILPAIREKRWLDVTRVE